MSHALPSGAPRMFRNHAGARGVWFRECFRALEKRLGPFDTDAVLRHYAGAASVLWCEFRTDTFAVERAEDERRTGRGRRPSVQAVARLKKRAALTWNSYDSAVQRLEALAAGRARHDDPLATLSRVMP